jgi:HD superfamily phosphodiesterase
MEVLRVLQVEDGIDGDLAVQCAFLHDVILIQPPEHSFQGKRAIVSDHTVLDCREKP